MESLRNLHVVNEEVIDHQDRVGILLKIAQEQKIVRLQLSDGTVVYAFEVPGER